MSSIRDESIDSFSATDSDAEAAEPNAANGAFFARPD